MDDAESVLHGIGGASNVLLLGPAVDAEVDAGCKQMLGREAQKSMESMSTVSEKSSLSRDGIRPLFVVTFTLPPRSWMDRWDEQIGDRPEDVVVVTTSDTFAGPSDSEDLGEEVTVEYLSSPGDLTGLGMLISKYLERWHEQEKEMALCFDSLTTLLQYEELHNVYRFLHLMTTRLSGAGSHAHFHLDPDTQDDQTVSTLSSTFDAIAQYDGSAWEVKSR